YGLSATRNQTFAHGDEATNRRRPSTATVAVPPAYTRPELDLNRSSKPDERATTPPRADEAAARYQNECKEHRRQDNEHAHTRQLPQPSPHPFYRAASSTHPRAHSRAPPPCRSENLPSPAPPRAARPPPDTPPLQQQRTDQPSQGAGCGSKHRTPRRRTLGAEASHVTSNPGTHFGRSSMVFGLFLEPFGRPGPRFGGIASC